MVDNRPIGVFDSGLGGLTVVREIIKVLPNEEIIYIGDTARVPWGTRGKETIINFSYQLAHFLLNKKVKFIVIACHTASSAALKPLKGKIKIPLLGVVNPGVKEALKKSKNLRIGVIGTQATIQSRVWERILKKQNSSIKVFSMACPLFVPLVEEGLVSHQATQILGKQYLKPLIKKKIDTLILACTHYPLINKLIKDIVGENVTLINPGQSLALSLKKELRHLKILGKHQSPQHKFYFTDVSSQLPLRIKRFLGFSLRGKIIPIPLDEL